MEFEQIFNAWQLSRAACDNLAADRHVRTARRLTSSTGATAWEWIESSLRDKDRKWFVAEMFDSRPVPRRLLKQMIHAGVLETNPSSNRRFIEPGVASFGAGPVLSELLSYLQSGTNEEKAGAASALYWVPRGPDPDPTLELRDQLRCQMLRVFIANEDLNVRRRITPMLVLDESKYPSDVRPLVNQAIHLARLHSDDYIRQRVEVQLGAGGPFMAIPNAH